MALQLSFPVALRFLPCPWPSHRVRTAWPVGSLQGGWLPRKVSRTYSRFCVSGKPFVTLGPGPVGPVCYGHELACAD